MNAPVDIVGLRLLPTVMRVMPENITALWDQIESLLGPALVLVSTHTTEDVRRALLAMRAQLWAQIVGDTVEAVATTEFVEYPVGIFVRVWHAGARRDRTLDGDAFFTILEQWRVANGCIGFEAIGRHGWLRKFPTAKVEGLIMRMIP